MLLKLELSMNVTRVMGNSSRTRFTLEAVPCFLRRASLPPPSSPPLDS